MDPSSSRPEKGPAHTTRPVAAAPALPERLRAELESLEQRLESSLVPGTGMDICEPCVWHCACFLVHGS